MVLNNIAAGMGSTVEHRRKPRASSAMRWRPTRIGDADRAAFESIDRPGSWPSRVPQRGCDTHGFA